MRLGRPSRLDLRGATLPPSWRIASYRRATAGRWQNHHRIFRALNRTGLSSRLRYDSPLSVPLSKPSPAIGHRGAFRALRRRLRSRQRVTSSTIGRAAPRFDGSSRSAPPATSAHAIYRLHRASVRPAAAAGERVGIDRSPAADHSPSIRESSCSADAAAAGPCRTPKPKLRPDATSERMDLPFELFIASATCWPAAKGVISLIR